LAAGKRRKLEASAAPMAGFARGAAAFFLLAGLDTRRGILRLSGKFVNPS